MPDPRLTPQTSYFASLCNLTVSMMDANYMATFIEGLQECRNLHSIRLLPGPLTSVTTVVNLFTAVSPIRSLEKIQCEFPPLAKSGAADLTSEIIALLYPLRALKNLLLEELRRVCLNDEDLKDMASAWPQLEFLRLRLASFFVRQLQDPDPAISLGGVAVLYQACPRLHIIDLDVNDSLEVPPPLVGRLPLLAQPLRNDSCPIFNIGKGSRPFVSTSLGHEMVVLLVSALFPSLEFFASGSDINGWKEGPKLWREAKRNPDVITQAARRQLG